MEKMGRLNTTESEDEEKQNNGISLKEDEDTKQRRGRWFNQGMTDGQGKFLKPSQTNTRVGLKRDEKGFLQSNMCHQCQRNDKGEVVRCTKCKTKRYCHPCMATWYPGVSADAFAEACPVCQLNCNCISCLRMEAPVETAMKIKEKSSFTMSRDQKIQHSKYMIKLLLPCIEQINKEQVIERELEAKIQGVLVLDTKIIEASMDADESIYCNNCRTSVVDYHRSCPRCGYDLCLNCCRELRDGHLQGGEKGPSFRYVNYGYDYLHGGKKNSNNVGNQSLTMEDKLEDNLYSPSQWKSKGNGVISCPPETKGGCGEELLELKCLFPDEYVSKLLVEAKEILDADKIESVAECLEKSCSCSKLLDGDEAMMSPKIRKAASREESSDNALYCPSAVDIEHGNLKHFQWHWSKGEPVIVSNVLETTLGLSWEPMVLWRAFRQIKNLKRGTYLNVTAINCLDWREVDVNAHQFFKGYSNAYSIAQFDRNGWPQILKLKDCPPSTSFEQLVPRHGFEFISCLPFKVYTHPQDGHLNLVTKLPPGSIKPDMGPKTYIAYGFNEELGRGDSVTKLHYNMSDVVNVLTHVKGVTVDPSDLQRIKKVKLKHAAQDQIEISGVVQMDIGEQVKASKESDLSNMNMADFDDAESGALWDIFRQQDVPKLEEYLKRHFNEFRHIYGNLLPEVIHPIHDQTIYLTLEHKKRLKEEYGIEPWTFVQRLGDAVIIPAGCPHQVRNLKNCTKVALHFVSPENILSCFQLTEEFRLLPLNHRAKEDKLEVRKMSIHAMRRAVNDAKGVEPSQPRKGVKLGKRWCPKQK
ncbi:lysine-specific demethylase JMJ25-like isoform X2 [Salvia miltiorrhiza]|nr:lysine-specific demethylase JMJ25-like isoform X2 [Salvia miltiorrhiza]